MPKVGIFFGSTSGNTEKVAKLIAAELSDLSPEVKDIKKCAASDLAAYDALVIGVPTYDEGMLQEDWDSIWPDMDSVDLSGKKVALFGLGDQDTYPEYFVSAMGTIYHKVRECGAAVVGSWPTDGYDFERSEAVVGGAFVGLAIDEDNQSDLTDERVSKWCAQIKSELV